MAAYGSDGGDYSAEIVDRARALRPLLEAHSSEATTDRKLPKKIIGELHASGLMKLLQPRQFGGVECSYSTFMAATEELAKSCSSTAWVYSVFTEHMWVIASFPECTQLEVWGENPNALASSSFVPRATARRVIGGYELTGTWPFSSGCDHAEWVILGATGAESAEILDVLVPKADFKIVDDWHVMGLQGTGSKTIALDKAFVPDHRSLRHDDIMTGNVPGRSVHPRYPLIGAPRGAFAPYSLAPITLALAQRAFDLVVGSLAGRVSRGVKVAELEAAQVGLAEASSTIEYVRTMLRHLCRHSETDLATGRLTNEKIVTSRRDVVRGMRWLRSTIEQICNLAGASWIYNGHPLQSILRDIIVASMHRTANWEGAAVPYGRMALGLDRVQVQ